MKVIISYKCFIKGAQIVPSLKNLAERRTDIFGSEETVIGRKVHTYIQYIKGIGWLFITRVTFRKYVEGVQNQSIKILGGAASQRV